MLKWLAKKIAVRLLGGADHKPYVSRVDVERTPEGGTRVTRVDVKRTFSVEGSEPDRDRASILLRRHALQSIARVHAAEQHDAHVSRDVAAARMHGFFDEIAHELDLAGDEKGEAGELFSRAYLAHFDRLRAAEGGAS